MQKYMPICLFMGIWKEFFFIGLRLPDSNKKEYEESPTDKTPIGLFCEMILLYP